MKKRAQNRRQFILRGLGTLLAIALIFILVREEGWDEVRAAFQNLSLGRFLAGLGVILVSRFFVATRWYVLLRSGNVNMSYSRAVMLTFTGLFSTNFLPTTIGGDVVRLAGAMQMGYDRAVCLASIAADRLIGMFGMLFVLPFGLPAALSSVSQSGLQAGAFMSFVNRSTKFVKRTLQTFSIWLRQPAALLASLGCTFGHMLCTFLAMAILIEGFGSHVDFWLISGLWSVSYFVTLIPISINGFGIQELSLTYLFSTAGGLSATTSLAVAVMIRLLYLVTSLPGAATLPSVLAAMDKSAPGQENSKAPGDPGLD